MTTQDSTVIHIRAPADLVRKLDNAAARELRNRSTQAVYLLQNALTCAERQRALEQHAADNIDDRDIPDDGLSAHGVDIDVPQNSKRTA